MEVGVTYQLQLIGPSEHRDPMEQLKEYRAAANGANEALKTSLVTALERGDG